MLSPWPYVCTLRNYNCIFIVLLTMSTILLYLFLVANCIYSCLHNHVHMRTTHLWILSNPLAFWCVSGPHKCLGADGEALRAFLSGYIVLTYYPWNPPPTCCFFTPGDCMLPRVATEGKGPRTQPSLHVWGLTPAAVRCRPAATPEAGGARHALTFLFSVQVEWYWGAGILHRRYGC